MKRLLLGTAIVLWGAVICSSSLHATIQRYDTQPTKYLIINEAESSFMDLLGYQDIDISGPIVPWNRLKTYDQSKIINIVYFADEKYLPYTYTSLVSILDNSKLRERKEPIRFTIVLDEIEFKGTLNDDTTRSTNALFLLFNRDTYKYDIEYIPIPDRERERINQFNSYNWPKNVFLKLFVSNFLTYDRCIYLDGDTVCVNDIRELWNIDLKNACIGGCKEPFVSKINHPYYNGGVWLFDLKKMRAVDFANEIKTMTHKGQKRSKFYTEEAGLRDYGKEHGIVSMDCRFNMPPLAIPNEFHPNASSHDWAFKNNNSSVLTRESVINLTIMHYYYQPKPWDCVQQYEAARCPSYESTENNFWKTTWKHNPWSFWVWYKYYKAANL
ncbi:MAG: hypothetical protein LBP31_02675 [Holosporales bacterium]|jgi:lipopolysaccharide biosynthesis glycosyltransferase|nr:hypothetical protein [Holosporales bacterium]